jgi:hypothetical protein
MKHLNRLVFAMAVLVLAAIAVQSARADAVDDPTIEAGVITTLPGTLPAGSTVATETSLTFSTSYNTSAGTNYLAFYLNDTGTTWTDMTIIATAGGSTSQSHTYTNEAFESSLFPTGTTAAFSVLGTATSPANGGTPITFEQSGGTGVAPGDYLVIRYNNWPTSEPDSTFAFTMSTAAEDAAAPEPSSGAFLGVGLLTLFGLVGFAKYRKAGIAVA